MQLGLRTSDIGDALSWTDFRDWVTNLPPTKDSALFRAKHPKSWWWTPEIDFMSAVLLALKQGNWQRGGGSGPQPTAITKPAEGRKKNKKQPIDPQSPEQLRARKQAWLARRAQLQKKVVT